MIDWVLTGKDYIQQDLERLEMAKVDICSDNSPTNVFKNMDCRIQDRNKHSNRKGKELHGQQNEVLMHTCTELRSLFGISFCVIICWDTLSGETGSLSDITGFHRSLSLASIIIPYICISYTFSKHSQIYPPVISWFTNWQHLTYAYTIQYILTLYCKQ